MISAEADEAEIEIETAIEAGGWPPKAILHKLAGHAVKAAASRLPGMPRHGELSLLFTDDDRIANLNGMWRGKPNPTNVLSFTPPPPNWNEGPLSLGDIALGFETVAREAAAAHLTLADHITHLLVHGLMHLLGYDHDNDADAAAMESVEAEILASLGIADPYAGGEPEPIEPAGSDGI